MCRQIGQQDRANAYGWIFGAVSLLSDGAVPNQKVSKEEFVCEFKIIICPADKVGIRVRVDFLKGGVVVRARVRVIGLAVWVRVLGLGLRVRV